MLIIFSYLVGKEKREKDHPDLTWTPPEFHLDSVKKEKKKVAYLFTWIHLNSPVFSSLDNRILGDEKTRWNSGG